eukprot:scaffold439_cov114-Skeletonema_marinoi.AAC.2
MHSMGQRRLALGHNGHICRVILGAKIAISADFGRNGDGYPYYASCPLFPEDFQRIDVHGVQVYSTNFN